MIAKARPFAAIFGAIGIVYGDIGTSPLYAFREAMKPIVATGASRTDVIGVTSLMIWTVTIIVTLKYVIFLLRADNHGEGGTLALVTLILKRTRRQRGLIIIGGILGAALFIGDAMITPALSVLSALEGFTLVIPGVTPYLLPIAMTVMVMLFHVQAGGTDAVSKLFGPIMLIWFVVMGLGGAVHIIDDLRILSATNPVRGINFIAMSGSTGWLVLGAVFLTVTGAEALYADLAHFGRKPIQHAWLIIVFPALTLNYLGQGALVLAHPEAAANPFFLLFPEWALLPVVVLATAATIIASQAVITGTFSLVRQAIHLNFLPPLRIRFTSASNTGQIYIPFVNFVMAAGVIGLIALFRSSDALASAYGLSVTGAMLLTTLLALQYLRLSMRWSYALAITILLPLIFLEGSFFAANLAKLADGGYIPIVIAAVLVLAMRSWKKGTSLIDNKALQQSEPLRSVIAKLEHPSAPSPASVAGTAIFFTADVKMAPPVFLANLKHNQVLHKKNVILTVRTLNRPYVCRAERVHLCEITDRFAKVEVKFGYMEPQDVFNALRMCLAERVQIDTDATTFYVGRKKIICDPAKRPTLEEKLFLAMMKIALDPSDHFGLPSGRVVELGEQITL